MFSVISSALLQLESHRWRSHRPTNISQRTRQATKSTSRREVHRSVTEIGTFIISWRWTLTYEWPEPACVNVKVKDDWVDRLLLGHRPTTPVRLLYLDDYSGRDRELKCLWTDVFCSDKVNAVEAVSESDAELSQWKFNHQTKRPHAHSCYTYISATSRRLRHVTSSVTHCYCGYYCRSSWRRVLLIAFHRRQLNQVTNFIRLFASYFSNHV